MLGPNVRTVIRWPNKWIRKKTGPQQILFSFSFKTGQYLSFLIFVSELASKKKKNQREFERAST